MIYVYFLFCAYIASSAESFKITDVPNKGNDTNDEIGLFATNALLNDSMGASKTIAPNNKTTSADNVLLNRINGAAYSTASNNRTSVSNILSNIVRNVDFTPNNRTSASNILSNIVRNVDFTPNNRITLNDIIKPSNTIGSSKTSYRTIIPDKNDAIINIKSKINRIATSAPATNANQIFPKGQIAKPASIILTLLLGGISLLGLGLRLFGLEPIILGGKLLAIAFGRRLLG